MRKIWMKAGAVSFALGVLGLLMVQAGMASGCGSSQTAAPAQTPAAEPPITTKASEAPTSQPAAEATAKPTAEPESDPPPSKVRYAPASKAGPIFYAPNQAPEPPQQQSQP